MRTNYLQLASALILTSILHAPGAVLYVDVNSTNPVPPFGSWAKAATVIQDAVDAASTDDTVFVTDGVYQTGGSVAHGTLTNRVAVTKPLTLQSVNGPDVTIIRGYQLPGPTNGLSAVRCVYLTNNAVLSGFTLTGGATRVGRSSTPSIDCSGGGVNCESTNAVVTNCVITSNLSGGYLNSGGGAYSGTLNRCSLSNNLACYPGNGGGASVSILNDCLLQGNSANWGGGSANGTLNRCMLVQNCTFGYSSAGGGAFGSILNSCTLAGNYASNYFGGGAAGTLNNCLLITNWAQTAGGAYGTLSNCVFIGNRATGDGGGAQGTLYNCVLIGNCAGRYGGGCWNSGVSITVNGCLFWGNWATNRGGGVYGGIVRSCTLAGNSALSQGGGAYGSWLTNCIVYSNSAPTGPNYYPSYYPCVLNYCCTTPLPSAGDGNFTNEPLFIDLLATNLHLQSTSPCINAGNNSHFTGSIDLDGNPRISGGTLDVGAYEFQKPGSILPFYWLQNYNLPTDGTADYADTDSDRLNNWQEWMAGTVPTNAASVLSMLSPTGDASGVTVWWQSVPGKTYYLQRSTNLSVEPAFTLSISNLTGQAGTTTSYQDTTATGPGPFFYRVGVQ